MTPVGVDATTRVVGRLARRDELDTVVDMLGTFSTTEPLDGQLLTAVGRESATSWAAYSDVSWPERMCSAPWRRRGGPSTRLRPPRQLAWAAAHQAGLGA